VRLADTIRTSARNSAEHEVRDGCAGDAANVVRILEEADDVVGEEWSPVPLEAPVHAAHTDRARVAVDAACPREDGVVDDAYAAWDAL
jgi:hypothetical protein